MLPQIVQLTNSGERAANRRGQSAPGVTRAHWPSRRLYRDLTRRHRRMPDVTKHFCAVAALVALVLAAPASAGPFLDWSTPAHARVGDLIRVQAGAGVRMYALLPLYLVA